MIPNIVKKLELKILFKKYILILIFDPIWSFLKPRNEEKRQVFLFLDKENETQRSSSACPNSDIYQVPELGVRALNPGISASNLWASFTTPSFPIRDGLWWADPMHVVIAKLIFHRFA